MEELSLSVEKREGLGKGAAGRLRREGIVPAVLYGAGLKEAISLQMKAGELEQVLHTVSGRKVLLKLTVEGEKKARQTILQSVQRHPVSRAPLHIDFYEVEKGHTVVVEIPITVDLEVTEASVALKGDTATGVTKKVTTETGLQVQVPNFIEQGDIIKVNTDENSYVTRV